MKTNDLEKGAINYHHKRYEEALRYYKAFLDTIDEDDDYGMESVDFNIWEALDALSKSGREDDVDLQESCSAKYKAWLPEGIRDKEFWFRKKVNEGFGFFFFSSSMSLCVCPLSV